MGKEIENYQTTYQTNQGPTYTVRHNNGVCNIKHGRAANGSVFSPLALGVVDRLPSTGLRANSSEYFDVVDERVAQYLIKSAQQPINKSGCVVFVVGKNQIGIHDIASIVDTKTFEKKQQKQPSKLEQEAVLV